MSLWKRLPIVIGAVDYTMFLRPQMLKWGTRLGESQRLLPGDELIPKPNFQMTHALNIDAPPEAVWPWIAQMGRERTGYYALDLFTNQGIPSATFVRQDIPAPEVGQEMDGGLRILSVEPHRQLIFGGFSLRKMGGVVQDMTTLYLLERRRDGSTRLLVRRRALSYGLGGELYNKLDEPVYFAFSMQQLKQLKNLAKSGEHLHHAEMQTAQNA